MTTRTDNFNRADNASVIGTPSDAGGAYSGSGGTFGISSNQAYAPAAGTGDGLGNVRVLDSGDADGSVEFTIVTRGDYWLLAFRWTDDNNFDALFCASGGNSQFYKNVATTVTSTSSNTSIAWADGDVCKITFSGTTVEVFKNGVSAAGPFTISSANTTGTKHGFGIYSNSAIRIDGLTVATSGGGDTTAPVLTTPVGTKTGTTTATIGATTDEGNGTLYGVVSTSSTAPTATQVKAGQMHTGSAAAFAGSTSVGSTGAKTISATGLTANTTYYSHCMHEDASGNKSNVVTSSSFTTDATALVAGTIIQVCTAAAVTIYGDGTNGSTAASGGVTSYSYAWRYSDTDPGFTFASGTLLSGETSANLSVSGPTTTIRYYKRQVTDSAGSPSTAVTECAPGRLLDANIRVLFIGDSLYSAAPSGGSSPPTNFSNFAAYLGGRLHAVAIYNAGASGSKTAHWLPTGDGDYSAWPDTAPDTSGAGLLAWAKSNLTVSGTTFVVLRLGANDAIVPVSAATYGAHLSTIVSDLTGAGYKVILNYPTFGRPNGSYGAANNKTFLDYQPYIDALVNNTTVFAGDKKQFDASAVITGWRADDVHPTAEGSRQLALADLLVVANAIYPATSSGGLLTGSGNSGGIQRS